MERIQWPEGKAFAFSIFDDPDSQTVEEGRLVYAFLRDLGLKTTKGVWPVRGPREPSDHGGTCAEPEYRLWAQELQSAGFEIGFHNATLHASTRAETAEALETFNTYFGHYPFSMANHYFASEGIYFGESRLSGMNRLAYNILTRGANRNRYFGHVPDHPYFWGDLCRARIKYVRNFVYGDINTLRACPYMPYHDPDRPYVNYWYASSEGSNASNLIKTLTERNQDTLEAENGACIMYTHFGHGYVENGRLTTRFKETMTALSKRNGWFVPVHTLLDFLLERRGRKVIRSWERSILERRWLTHKVRYGTA